MNIKDITSKFNVVVDFKVSHVTYRYNDYLFDIVCDLGKYEFGYWLYHKFCGIKCFMRGVSMNDISYTDFLFSVFCGIDEDIKFYDEKYNF